MTDINRRDVDYSRLLDPTVMSNFTLDRQRIHHGDAAAYEEILATLETALRAQVVPGDGRFSARLRARRAVGPWRSAVKHARALEAAMQEGRTRLADHQAHVDGLPAQREAKQLKKAGRRETVSALTAKSLHKSAAAFAAPAAEDTTATAAPAVQPGPAARGITDLFNQQQRRGA